jgi:uncharacterized protein YciI
MSGSGNSIGHEKRLNVRRHYVFFVDLDRRITKSFEMAVGQVVREGRHASPGEVRSRLPAKLARLMLAHIGYAETATQDGTLSISGVCADFVHAILVYRASSEKKAERLFMRDPYYREGLYRKWRVYEWNPNAGVWWNSQQRRS